MTEDEALIQAMFEATLSCCADVAEDEACKRCQLLSRASKRMSAASAELDRWRARFAEAVIDGDRMRLTLHDLAFAAPTVGDEHRNAKGWLHPKAWGEYVSRVQKLAGGAIRCPKDLP